MDNSELPLKDPMDELMRILQRAKAKNVTLRVMGSTAIRIHSPKFTYLHKILDREITDIDFVGYNRHADKVRDLLLEMGYMAKEFASVISTTRGRQTFIDDKNERKVDVFTEKFDMCHSFVFRLNEDYPTVPLSDLLLAKAQIVKINEKDLKDIIVLLREHQIGNSDKETINLSMITEILSQDWGFYYTVKQNLQKVKSIISNGYLDGKGSDEDKADVVNKIESIIQSIEKSPKTLSWKLRSRVGTKKKWYKEVELTH